jgi:hypothetical protein
MATSLPRKRFRVRWVEAVAVNAVKSRASSKVVGYEGIF